MPKKKPGEPMFVSVRAVHDAPTVLWDLLEERPPESRISHTTMPSADEHLEFVMHHPYKVWFLIKVDGDWVGSAYLTKHRELGVFVFKDYQGLGYGKWAVREMQRRFPDRPMLANIAPGNTRSRVFFEALGFGVVQWTLKADPPSSSPK